MSEKRTQSVLNGALILTVATLMVKVIGAIYKIPLTGLIGAAGRGYFNSAYEIYTPIYAISMAGLPTALARLVSEDMALHRYREVRYLYRVAKRLFFITGILGTVTLLIIAFPYTRYIADSRNLPAVLAITPSIFFCCSMSLYRGYYEGLRDMKPTAVSQVIEALGKLLLGLFLAFVAVRYGLSQFNAGKPVFGKIVENEAEAYSVIYPISAAGAVLGVTIGTVFGLIYLMVHHKMKSDGITRIDLINSPAPLTGTGLMKKLIIIALPMVASALILNITNLVDLLTIQKRLAHALQSNPEIVKGMYARSLEMSETLDKDIVKYLYGAYGSALDFRNLIPTITMSLGVSALPAISAAWALRDGTSVRKTIESVMRVTMIIAVPAGFGMAVLSTQIFTIIYGGNNPDIIPISAPIMRTYAWATALFALSTPITNMLQGIGRTDIPLKSLVVGTVVKIGFNFVLVGNPSININGAPIGSILCYAIVVSINLIMLIRLTHTKINVISVFIKPLICGGLSAGSAWIVYKLIHKLIHVNIIVPTGAAVVAAVIVYAVSLLFIKGISADDVTMLPKGEKIAKSLEKYGLLG
ncbi:MAG: polysaccharide biosynthesis protein [Clostridiales bacterium]|nr:polysaccharide biosynthesis protein [Clostridiales bacterium]